jgi:hypothetical protein
MISLRRLPLVQSAVGRRIDTPPEHAQPLDLLADLLAPSVSGFSFQPWKILFAFFPTQTSQKLAAFGYNNLCGCVEAIRSSNCGAIVIGEEVNQIGTSAYVIR